MTRAIPDTMADMRNTIGMRTLLHHGLAFTDPKMKPTYPWSRKADGMPMMVIARIAFRSKARAASLTSVEKRDRARWIQLMGGRSCLARRMRSPRYSNHISRSRTPMRYQAYTKPNMAIADWRLGVRKIS